MLTLGQKFWIREERSDWECTVVGIKEARFVDASKNYTDFIVEQLRLNSYHESFEKPEDRTQVESYRLDPNDNTLKVWVERDWPGTVRKWQKVDTKTFKFKKPKDLRIGAHVD